MEISGHLWTLVDTIGNYENHEIRIFSSHKRTEEGGEEEKVHTKTTPVCAVNNHAKSRNRTNYHDF